MSSKILIKLCNVTLRYLIKIISNIPDVFSLPELSFSYSYSAIINLTEMRMQQYF